MCNWLWATADCHEWPANMYSMSCNLPVRSWWSFIPVVLPLAVEPARFCAELYHPTLSKSRCVLVKKAHSLNRRRVFPAVLTIDAERVVASAALFESLLLSG